MSEEITQIIDAMAAVTPDNDPTTLGNLLRLHCGLTDTQLAEAIEMQRRNPKLKLGDAVVGLGYASAHQVARTLERQRGIRQCDRAGVWDTGKLADWVAEKLLRWRR